MTVLKYLKNKTKRFHTFVSNRVNAILSLSSEDEWRYVPTGLNPADEGSRGIDAGKLSRSTWIWGPQFLSFSEEEWPKGEPNGRIDEVEDNDPEVRKQDDPENEARQEGACHVFVQQADEVLSPIRRLTDHYSSAFRLRRAVAVWMRAIHWLHNRSMRSGPFTVEELDQAEHVILQRLQQEHWPQEYSNIEHNKQAALKRKSPLYRLNAVMDRGLLMTQSRVRETLPIVPPDRLATLLVAEAHELQSHLGRQSTAAAAARKYHIIGLNKIVRRVVRDCTVCQIIKASPGLTIMAPMPDFRLETAHPFKVTGVDYFGPFTLRGDDKVYGVIFTCAVSRAVHLEVAGDLSGSSFLNALRRFIARRGHVSKLISDNGTNFTAANKALKKELAKQRSEALQEEMRKNRVDWQFTPPGASHHGGFWERLIRIIRQVLDANVKHAGHLNRDAFHTLLCECEAVLNARPLTTVSDDIDDLEPLTPNHILLGRPSTGQAPPATHTTLAQLLRNQWKGVQHEANQFWRRWHCEYKQLLRTRTKWFIKNERNLRPGDAVLIVDPIKPRSYWKLGRVITVHAGRDGEVRSAEVMTGTGTFLRPITKLCLLETASQ